MTHLGTQWTAELYGCDPALLDDERAISDLMLAAADVARATIVDSRFHRFSPHGVSGVVIIAESHIAIHTWPEHGYAALDVFTCGDCLRTDAAFGFLADRLRATRVASARTQRGDPRRIAAHRAAPPPRRHPALYRYDDAFVARFLRPSPPRELAEQVFKFDLFTPEWCALLVEECEHHGGWVTVRERTAAAHGDQPGLEDTYEPDTTLSWESLPGLEDVYAAVLERHVRPVLERLWPTWRLQKWDPPATRRYEPDVVAGMDLHHDAESVAMVGYLNADFTGGGTEFPRWGLVVGDHASVRVGSVVVFPGGVSHAHAARPVTSGRRYTLANSFY